MLVCPRPQVLSSGLRVGWVSGPSDLLERIELHQQVAALHSSGLSQAVTAAILRRWGEDGWRAHCAAVRALYRPPSHGMFFWFDLRPSGCTDSLALVHKRAVEAQVLLIPGASFAAGTAPQPSTYVRAAFSTASEAAMDAGIKRLAALLRAGD